MRAAVAKEYVGKRETFPKTTRGLVVFSILAFVTGIAEEMMYRWFAYQYFLADWGLPAWVALIAVSILFGLAHFQQGVERMIDTALLGVALSWLYLTSGSLMVPIIFHIAYNLKVVLTTIAIKKSQVH